MTYSGGQRSGLGDLLPPVMLCAGLAFLNRGSYPLLIALGIGAGIQMAGLCMGYGADKFWTKALKRGYCSLTITAACLPLAFITGLWWLYLVQALSGLVVSVGLGTTNPVDANAEEFLIGMSQVLLYCYF